MTDLDLTDAVEAAARAWFERQQRGRMDATVVEALEGAA